MATRNYISAYNALHVDGSLGAQCEAFLLIGAAPAIQAESAEAPNHAARAEWADAIQQDHAALARAVRRLKIKCIQNTTITAAIANQGAAEDSDVEFVGSQYLATLVALELEAPMAVEKYKLGSISTLLATDLNSLANNALALTSTAYNNVQGGGGGDGATLADLELVATYGTAPTTNTGVAVWFLSAADGTNHEDGGTSVTPARSADVVFPVRAVTTAQRINRRVSIPWGIFKVLVKNDATGQAMAASGNTLKIRPVFREGTA